MLFSRNNVLHQNQFGFRKNNSTIYALTQIKLSIDSGKYGCGIFIDLRKAFDTVSHKILLSKLEHYVVKDVMLDWFESYFSKCKQYVSVNGQSSDPLDITCGVRSPRFCPRTITIFIIYK